MEKYIESTDGYIVFEDGGESLMTYAHPKNGFQRMIQQLNML